MRFIAFDPGHTTGVCVATTGSNTCGVNDFQVECLEIPWDRRFAMIKALIDGLLLTTEPQPPEVVITESFRLRQGRALEQSGSDFPSIQIIAIIQTFLWARGRDGQLVFQEPSCMSRVKVLEQHAQDVIGSAHKLDAYCHLRYYLVTHRKDGNK